MAMDAADGSQAVGQICATACVEANLDQCVRLVGKAAAGGAKVLFLPEAADYIAPSAQATLDLAAPQSTSPFVTGLRAAAKQHSVAVHVGIHHPVGAHEAGHEAEQQPPRPTRLVVNRALYIDAEGVVQEAATYDKLHVFDYGTLRESSTVRPGAGLTAPFDSPVGRIGSLICFDVRFPETAVALAQPGPTSAWRDRPAQILTYPSAFTLRTGEPHWETLLRARAIETQSWVVAAAQVGRHNERRASYGRSMVVDPWGTVRVRLRGVSSAAGQGGDEGGKGEADEGAVEEIGFVEMDMGLTDRVRGQMPLQRRTDVYPECKNVGVEPS